MVFNALFDQKNEFEKSRGIMNFFDGLNLWVSVCLMAVNRRSLGQGLVLRRYVKRSKARVINPLNRYRGATLEVQGRVVHLRGFRTSDYEVFYQIFGFTEYEDLCRFLKINDSEAPAFVFLDCGANIGLASAYMQIQFPNSVFVGVEPSQENLDLARQNMNYDKVFLRALTSKNGNKVKLFSPTKENVEWALRTKEDAEGEIETLNLEALLEELIPWRELPYVLKVDIEGAEFDVFRNASAEVLHQFDMIIVEVHDFVDESNSLVRHICSFGYYTFPMGEYWFFKRF